MSGGTVIAVNGEFLLAAQSPVFYFDVEPVLARSLSLKKNPERALLMCENCVKRLAPSDLMLRRETGFFLAVESCSGSAVDVLVQEINVALLKLFFGTESLAGLSTIFRLAERAEVAQLIEAGVCLTPALAGARPKVRMETETVETDPLARLAQAGVPGYKNLRAGFMPLVNLKRDTASIFLGGPVLAGEGNMIFGPAALVLTDSHHRAALDEAMLDYAVGFARQIVPTRAAAAIGAAVSFDTLASSRGRQVYQKALRAANMTDNPFFLVKIECIPAGTPFTRLAEIVSMVRPFVKRVFLELPEGEYNLTQEGYLGVAALMATMPRSGIVAGAHLTSLVAAAAAQHALPCVTEVEDARTLCVLRAAGIRFAAMRAGEENIHLGGPPVENLQTPMACAA